MSTKFNVHNGLPLLENIQAGESDLIISINVPEVTNYHSYYLCKSIEIICEILILLLQQIG